MRVILAKIRTLMISEFIVGGLAFIIAIFAYLLYGAQNDRIGQSRRSEKNTQKEFDDWSGVIDVKRRTRDNLNNADYVDGVQNDFNDK